MPLWRGGPNTRTLPTVLLTPSASKAADVAHLCVPQNQALEVCRRFVPYIQVCGTHGREDLVNATITSNAEEEVGRPKHLWRDDIVGQQGTARTRAAKDREGWRTLAEGYLLQWKDTA